jgi:hypothetical protein
MTDTDNGNDPTKVIKTGVKVKAKAIEIVLSDGQKIIVHAPMTKDMGTFLRALPALTSFSRAFQAVRDAQDGLLGMPVDVSDETLQGIFPLLAVMTDITVEEFTDLPLSDGMAIMAGLALFAPNQPAAAQGAKPEASIQTP